MSHVSRRRLVASMASFGFVAGVPRASLAAASPQCRSVAAPPKALPPSPGTPLGTIAASKNILFGIQAGIASDPVYGPGVYDTVYQQAIFREKPAFIAYGSAFKFDVVCPDPPAADGSLVFTQKAYGASNSWQTAEDLTNGAMQNSVRARADALIWNNVNTAPAWLKTLPAGATTSTPEYKYNLSYLVRYISAAIQKMTQLQAGKADFFHAACLVNEPIVPNFKTPESPGPASFRDGPWLPPGRTVGANPQVPDYILLAFRNAEYYRGYWAKQLNQPATTAKFFINEVLCDTDQFGPVMRPALIALLKAMLAANLKIGGVGLECHLQPQMMSDAYHPDWTNFGTFIQDIGALGLDVYITELDVIDYEASCSGQAASSADSEYRIDIYYDTFLRKVLSYPNVKSVTLWDLSDRYTFYRYQDVATIYGYDQIPRPKPANTPWPNCMTMPRDAAAISCPRPDVFDDAMAPKPARKKIAAALQAAPYR